MKKKVVFPISLVALAISSLACSAVSNFMATPTALPTFTPAPTPTPASSPTPEAGAEILSDDFSVTSSGWGTGSDTESSVEYLDGGLHFTVNSGQYVTWSNPDQEDYSDVHVDVSVQNNSTDELALVGIICHEQETQSFYYLGVASDGYYAIALSEVGKDNVFLSDGKSSLVPTGNQTFTLGADCGSGHLALYVNGEQIATAEDSTFTSGHVGLFAWSDKKTDSTDAKFDDFVLKNLK